MTDDGTVFRGLYYPYARTVDETTLKRCVLLYDEILFVDPVGRRVRDELFAREQLPYLPENAAASLEADWDLVRERYGVLEEHGILRLVDPDPVVRDPARGRLIADALGADLNDPGLDAAFSNGYPRLWSMLRSRIPEPAYAHLRHQIPARVLPGRVEGTPGERVALMLDGRPDALPDRPALPDDGREYAAVLPYLAGSSIAVSAALALADEHDAVPVTDSDAHFRLLGVRMRRAAAQLDVLHTVPGLAADAGPRGDYAAALVEQRVVDAVVSHADLAALSLEQVLEYRERTADERAAFRRFLAETTAHLRTEPWSPAVEAEIRAAIDAARAETSAHAASLRDAYRSLFHRTLASLAVTAAPAVLATVFPAIAPIAALLFGGTLTGLATDPVKEILTTWTERDRTTSSLAYLVDLPR